MYPELMSKKTSNIRPEGKKARHDQTLLVQRFNERSQFPALAPNCQVLFNALVCKTISSFVRVEADHEIIVPRANFNLTSSRIRQFVPFTLAECTRQIREHDGADTLRERRRGCCIGEEAEYGGNLVAVGSLTGGGLPDPPSRFGDGNAGDLCQETGTGVVGVNLD